jgi:hypothetical protein
LAEHVEQPLPFWAVTQSRPDARNAVVDHHIVKPITRGLGLDPLVLKGLVGNAHSAIQNGFHRRLVRWGGVHFGCRPHGQFDPCGRFWQAILDDLWAMPLGTPNLGGSLG